MYFIYLIISYQIVYYRFYYYYFVFQGMTSIELLINFMYQGLQTRTPNRSVKREGVLVVDRANKNAHLQLALESYSLALVSVITGRKTITLLKREFFDSFTNRFSLSLNVYFRPCFWTKVQTKVNHEVNNFKRNVNSAVTFHSIKAYAA